MATLTRGTGLSIPSLAVTLNDPGPHQIHGRAATDLLSGDVVRLSDVSGVPTLTKASGAGVPAPLAPELATAASGGTVAAGTYQAAVTYMKADGTESSLSVVVPIVTSGATSTITITSPAASTGATKYRAYVSAPNGLALYLQNGAGTAIATDLVISAPPVTNTAAPPAVNGTSGVLANAVGLVLKACTATEKAVAWHGVEARYAASGLTAGAKLYVSATAGAIDDAPTVGGTSPIAVVVNATNIFIFPLSR